MQTCYWLVPAEPYYALLQGTIQRLAAELDAPVFAPHVTLFAAPSNDTEDPEALLRHSAPTPIPLSAPIALHLSGFGWSDTYTKSFYLELNPSFEMAAWAERLRHASRHLSHYQFRPHISLLYKRLSPGEQEALSQEVSATLFPEFARLGQNPNALDQITFDQAQIIFAPDEIETREDVECWQDLASFRLY